MSLGPGKKRDSRQNRSSPYKNILRERREKKTAPRYGPYWIIDFPLEDGTTHEIHVEWPAILEIKYTESAESGVKIRYREEEREEEYLRSLHCIAEFFRFLPASDPFTNVMAYHKFTRCIVRYVGGGFQRLTWRKVSANKALLMTIGALQLI